MANEKIRDPFKLEKFFMALLIYIRAALKTIIFLGDLYFMVTHSYLLIGLKPLMREAFQ